MSGFKSKLIAGVVVTGGGAHLKNLVQLVEYVTGLDARIGLPIEHLASSKIDIVKHPMYSTGVGLVLNGFEDYEMKEDERRKKETGIQAPPQEETEAQRERKGLVGRIIFGVKEFFNEGMDQELK